MLKFYLFLVCLLSVSHAADWVRRYAVKSTTNNQRNCMLYTPSAYSQPQSVLAVSTPKVSAMAVASDGTAYYCSSYCGVILRQNFESDNFTLFAGVSIEMPPVSGSGIVDTGDNGPATSAYIFAPKAMVIDSINENLFVCNKYYIRKINIASGIITLYAGNKSAPSLSNQGDGSLATTVRLDGCSGLSINSTGFLFVASNSSRIRVINPFTRIIQNFVGSCGVPSRVDGDFSTARFLKINSMWGDNRDLFVTESDYMFNPSFYTISGSNCWIRRINMVTGIVSTFAGTGACQTSSGTKTQASPLAATSFKVENPGGFCGRDLDGSLYITETGFGVAKGTIRKIDSSGIVTRIVGGTGGAMFVPSSNTGVSQWAATSQTMTPYYSSCAFRDNMFLFAESDPSSSNGGVYRIDFTAPTMAPSMRPTAPTLAPSKLPTAIPTLVPSKVPTAIPTQSPTELPTVIPTIVPSQKPSIVPSMNPTVIPSQLPTILPSYVPSIIPTVAPSQSPTVPPSLVPTVVPTVNPSQAPTVVPSVNPTQLPTVLPSLVPTVIPTLIPTQLPTVIPTEVPTVNPSQLPTVVPTVSPTQLPTVLPSIVPTVVPTVNPTQLPTVLPSIVPTVVPTITPTQLPTVIPSINPTQLPTVIPSLIPTQLPTILPSFIPTVIPTQKPTVSIAPTQKPSIAPSRLPSQKPSLAPSLLPTQLPTVSIVPTQKPSIVPTQKPSVKPSIIPTIKPSSLPSIVPTNVPTNLPTIVPSCIPTVNPSTLPSVTPTTLPSVTPSIVPSVVPSVTPSIVPSVAPSRTPSIVPSVVPSVTPSIVPSVVPSVTPSIVPSVVPSIVPTARPTISSRPSYGPTAVPSNDYCTCGSAFDIDKHETASEVTEDEYFDESCGAYKIVTRTAVIYTHTVTVFHH